MAAAKWSNSTLLCVREAQPLTRPAADLLLLHHRQVSVGGVSCVSLPGLLGLGPLVTLQQLEVGPGPYEKSSLKVGGLFEGGYIVGVWGCMFVGNKGQPAYHTAAVSTALLRLQPCVLLGHNPEELLRGAAREMCAAVLPSPLPLPPTHTRRCPR